MMNWDPSKEIFLLNLEYIILYINHDKIDPASVAKM